jgi:hypothetical protein
MLGDTLRLNAYRDDIARSVSGRRVLEIGAGPMAVLTRMCLDADASHVVAVEGNPRAARQAEAELNRYPQYAGRWQILSGLSTDLSPADVPGGGSFDVLTLELYSYIAARERVVETVNDLRRRGFSFNSVISRGFETWVAPAQAPPQSRRQLRRIVRGSTRWPTWPTRPVAAFVRGNMREVGGLRLSEPSLWQAGDLEADVPTTTVAEIMFSLQQPARFAGLLFHNRLLFHNSVLDTGESTTHWGMYFVPLRLPAAALARDRNLTLHTRSTDPEKPSVFTLEGEVGGQRSDPAVFPARRS